MRKWAVTLIALVPMAAAVLALQSCGGVGGSSGGGGGGGGNSSNEFLALMSDEQRTADYIGSEACGNVSCHGGDDFYAHYQETAHFSEEVGCERCHGPGSLHQANAADEQLILRFPVVADPVVCGQCHGPISAQYAISKHAQLVQSPVEGAVSNPSRNGQQSKCVACHSGLLKIVQNQGYDETGSDTLGTMPLAEIKELAEATLTQVPHVANCATCHNPHRLTGNLTDTGQDVQLRRATFNLDTTKVAPGATSDQFTNFDHQCAQCHNGRGANGDITVLQSGTSRPNMHDSNQYNMLMGFGGHDDNPINPNMEHATIPGQCSKCHMPDSSHSMVNSYDKSCSPCHTADGAAARVASTRDGIVNGLYALRERMASWATTTFGDEDLWDYTSLIQEEGKTPPSQALVPDAIKIARHNYYFIIRSGDYGAHNGPYARHLLEVANSTIDDYYASLRTTGSSTRTTRTTRALTSAQKLQVLEQDRKKARRADQQALSER